MSNHHFSHMSIQRAMDSSHIYTFMQTLILDTDVMSLKEGPHDPFSEHDREQKTIVHQQKKCISNYFLKNYYSWTF